jgi:hypothetical protein
MMQPRVRLWVFALLALLIVGGWILLSSLNANAAASAPIIPRAEGQTGVPAIAVQANATVSPAQVTAYVTTHRVGRNVATDDSKKLLVGQPHYITNGDVKKALNGEGAGLPDAAPVVFVTLQGMFTFPGPHGVSAEYPYGFEVFDAKTGNLLLFGGLDQPPAFSK